MSIIVTGDDVALPVQLKKDGKIFAIDAGATIKAAVINLNRSETIIPEVTCLSNAAGADWDNSLVVVEFNSAATSAVTDYDKALLELQVDDGGKLTWFVSVEFQKGTIA